MSIWSAIWRSALLVVVVSVAEVFVGSFAVGMGLWLAFVWGNTLERIDWS